MFTMGDAIALLAVTMPVAALIVKFVPPRKSPAAGAAPTAANLGNIEGRLVAVENGLKEFRAEHHSDMQEIRSYILRGTR